MIWLRDVIPQLCDTTKQLVSCRMHWIYWFQFSMFVHFQSLRGRRVCYFNPAMGFKFSQVALSCTSVYLHIIYIYIYIFTAVARKSLKSSVDSAWVNPGGSYFQLSIFLLWNYSCRYQTGSLALSISPCYIVWLVLVLELLCCLVLLLLLFHGDLCRRGCDVLLSFCFSMMAMSVCSEGWSLVLVHVHNTPRIILLLVVECAQFSWFWFCDSTSTCMPHYGCHASKAYSRFGWMSVLYGIFWSLRGSYLSFIY